MTQFKLVREKRYGYLRINPLPSPQEVEKYYRDEFYAHYKNSNDSSLEVQQEEKKFFESRWEGIYERCVDFFGSVKGKSLVDIGCGYAQALLSFKRKGLKVSGVEPAPEAVTYAKRHGVKVFNSGIEDFSCVGGNRFDIVMMINVLEHLRSPVNVLRGIRKDLLKRHGLLILDVANDCNDFQMVADKEFKLKTWWYCPPNHINYFSATSLRKTLELCGYKIVACEASFPMELFLLMGDVYVGDPALGKVSHQKRVLFESLMIKHGKKDKLVKFYESLAKLDLGRQIVTYATPC